MTKTLKDDEKIIEELRKSEETVNILKTLFDNQLSTKELKKIIKIDNDKLENILSFLKKHGLIYDYCFSNDHEYGLTSKAILTMIFDLHLKI